MISAILGSIPWAAGYVTGLVARPFYIGFLNGLHQVDQYVDKQNEDIMKEVVQEKLQNESDNV